MHAERCASDDAKTTLAESRDGEIALDAAGFVEHLRVCQGPDGASHPVVGEGLQKVRCTSASHLDLRERSEIEHRRRLPASVVLDADRGRPQPARPTVRAQRLVAACAVRLEPVHSLPARFLTECRAELRQPRVHG